MIKLLTIDNYYNNINDRNVIRMAVLRIKKYKNMKN